MNDIINSIRRRIPWTIAQKIFRKHSVPTSQGWDRTISKLSEFNIDSEILEDLKSALTEHLLCGDKAVSFYSHPKGTAAQYSNLANNFQIPENEFSKNYPFLIPENKYPSAPLGVHLAAIEHLENGVAFVFSSIRETRIREPIDVDGLSAKLQSDFSDYDELVGIKVKKTQAFDVVWFSTLDDVVIHLVDSPRGTSHENTRMAQFLLMKAFREQVSNLIGGQIQNFFPAIQKVYSNSNEGMVVELAFSTTTGSLKNEKMRRKKSDLRQEVYHRGGKQALTTPIEPYMVSVMWKRKVSDDVFSNPEISLIGNTRSAASGNPTLDTANIYKCIDLGDFDYVYRKISNYI